MNNNRTHLLFVISLACLLAAPFWAEAAGKGDFNGDGYGDLVITAVREDVDGAISAGMVHVIYGRDAAGLNALDSQIWTQNSEGISDDCEFEDLFGGALAIGDFNGDDYDDLAITARYEDIGGIQDAGTFHVLYGSADGLTSVGSRQFTQDTPGVVDQAEWRDEFGGDLCAGDFNGDGVDDLAVGAQGEDVGTITGAGALHVFLGSSAGITTVGSQYWTQNSPGLLDECGFDDTFGGVLVSGDFNGDGRDDLAIGLCEKLGTSFNAGMVQVLYGAADGLSHLDQVWTQNSVGIADSPEESDSFGGRLTVGDYNGDGYDDLAVSAFWEKLGSLNAAGVVHVLFGSASRLRSEGSQLWTQNHTGHGQAETLDQFGKALASGDFNGDGRDELVIFVREDVNGKFGAGAVHVLRGTAGGPSRIGAQFWHQDSPGVLETVSTVEEFGIGLAVGDFDGNGRDDLAIGVPCESIGTKQQCGGVNVLYGGGLGLTASGDQFWSQAKLGETLEVEDHFGFILGAAR